MQIEIDRQVSHVGGTWAVGAAVGHYHATAAALAADLTTRSGDRTGLRLVHRVPGIDLGAGTPHIRRPLSSEKCM